jgi:hypothetical protein
MLAEMDEAIAGADRTTDTVARVAGQTPRSFGEYAELFSYKLTRDKGDAILARATPRDHRNPFGRVIVAQALRPNLTVTTRCWRRG